MTSAWSDGEKVVIKNPNGSQHVKDNVEQIFGTGEFDKLYDVKYTEDVDVGKYIGSYEFTSGYIPARVVNDLKEQDAKEEGLVDKFFSDVG